MLTYAQVGKQHDLAVGELNRIVVRTWIIQVDLPEPPNPVLDVPRFLPEKTQEKSGLFSLDLAFERNLGTREKAHGHFWFSNRGESVGRRVPKLRRNQLVPDLGRS
jgi:hypothetical protein